MKVTFFFRKPQADYFSIEQLFNNVQEHVAKEFEVESYYIKNASTGYVSRLKACEEAYQNQGDINHITGDVHYIVSFLKKETTILTIHDLEFVDRAKGLKRAFLKLFWLTIPVARVKYVTVISQATKDRLLKICKVKPEKVVVIPNGIDLNKFSFSPKEKLSPKPVLLQIGARHNKNLERLFEAVKGVECKLLIVGELDQAYRNQLTANNIDYENFVNVPYNKILELYNRCDIVTFVSTYEGFGLPIVEAQALGRPIVTSNLSSMPEVAGNGACLVDPFDVDSIRKGIFKVINDDDYRKDLVSEGSKNVRRFDIRTVSRQYSDLYKTVFKEQKN